MANGRSLDGAAATRRGADGRAHAGPGRHRGDAADHAWRRHARVLILTTFGLDAYVFDALRAGASGFMLKDAPPEEIVAGVRVVAGGDALLAPAVTRAVIEEFARQPQPSADRAPP